MQISLYALAHDRPDDESVGSNDDDGVGAAGAGDLDDEGHRDGLRLGRGRHGQDARHRRRPPEVARRRPEQGSSREDHGESKFALPLTALTPFTSSIAGIQTFA